MSVEPLEWCRQRVVVPGNPLAISLQFAAPEHRDRILAVRTVATEIAAIPATVSDETVARNKLAWWQGAVTSDSEPSHPAVVALHQSGAMNQLDAECWRPLVQGVEESIEAPRFEQFEQLVAHARRVGGALNALEYRALEGTEGPDPWERLGAAGYLFRVIRDLGLDARQGRWLVSLDLQAGFQVDRRQAEEGRNDHRWRGLVREMLQRTEGLRQAALQDIGPAEGRRQRHLLVFSALDLRLARMLAGRPGRILDRRLVPGRVGNVLAAWRAAVRANRRAAGSG